MAKGDAGAGGLGDFGGQKGWGNMVGQGLSATGDSMEGQPSQQQQPDEMTGIIKGLMDGLWLKKKQPEAPVDMPNAGPPAQMPMMDGGMSSNRNGMMNG